jgi:Na+-transporting methylmalonyl-CoA/oxaloacetate decarboxylase, beta subunit
MNKKRKIITIITIMSTFITVIYSAYYFIILLFVTLQLKRDISSVASIGIIGGADGPTSIFVSNAPHSDLILFLFLPISIIGIVYLVKTRKKKRDN